jgi:hypothetical protein
MWHLRISIVAAAAIFFLCLPELRADSLQLKNGNFVQGRYLGGTERAVQFEVNGKTRLYSIEEILSISFAAASADGGIPSNNADPKPNANTELNSTAKGNGALRTARSKPAEVGRSTSAVGPNSEEKTRVSPAAAHSLRALSRKLPVLSD